MTHCQPGASLDARLHAMDSEMLLTTQQFEDTLRSSLGHVISEVRRMIQTQCERPSVDDLSLQQPKQGGAGHGGPGPSRLVHDLQLQMQDLLKQMGMLNVRLGRQSSECAATVEGEYELRRLLSAESEKNRKLTQINNGLRNALIKPIHHIPDDQIETRFVKLASSIRGYVQSTYENEWDRTVVFRGDNEAFFRPLINKECDRNILNRVRGKIFSIILENILSRSYYPSRYGWEFESLEKILSKHLPSQNLKDFADWRSASIKCSRALTKESDVGLVGNMPKHSSSEAPRFLLHSAHYIDNFFLPLKRKKGTSEGKQLDRLSEVCLEAHRLAELMRSAGDIFQVEFENNSQPGDGFHLVEVENTETATFYKENGKIAFWAYGALTKRTGENPEDVVVVTKGSVFVYKFDH